MTCLVLSPEGKRVKEKYVDYAPGLPTAMVYNKGKLIQEYDGREYNTCCIVNLARRRIARFTKGSLQFPCQSNFGRSEMLLLTRHIPNHSTTFLVSGTDPTALSAAHR